ncbi:type I toxin-antitoxin system SymE family toxin [Terrimonas sp. NA20]|uniref:Type I toxin-antitoxin system SymE family toxin n=1 Tax=Terrimonas ginsenosidimutans TaxID=2908004 RepID=A0ABS9KXD2_9BACT|nr:SymE family type I addiction module toxin [Terrimonas ginsenosidimutans]MCG2616968.1 type I toxin-antitoxin system SymE family toxin [Terrimonas ginsenosidimutans]
MEKRKRRAKLHGRYRPCDNSTTGYKEVPWLNVSGQWLAKAGFGIGDAVEIIVEENVLTIKNAGHVDR